MNELQVELEKLRAQAEDCDLISSLAVDVAKRATFRRLATQFREMAKQLEADIAKRAASSGT